MAQLEKSKSGYYTIKIKGKYIHSKYSPVSEAINFVDSKTDLLSAQIVVIYGLGLGYHIKEILNRISKETSIYIFEWNELLIEKAKIVNANIFDDNRVNIIPRNDGDFYEKFKYNLELVKDIIIHKPSLESIKYENSELYSAINGYKISKIAIEKNRVLLEDNYRENRKEQYDNINKFLEKYKENEKAFVIAAAGPSLDYELNLLKENRDDFIIISVGSALRTLMNNSIIPDGIVIIDGNEVVKNQIRNFENEKIPLCFLSTASRWAVKMYKGPRYMFFNGEDGEKNITTGKTVAVAAMDIAIKCGAKKILLLGQDLAFLKDRSHTSTFEETYGFNDNVKSTSINRKVKGVKDEFLETTGVYLYFKKQIEKLIADNSHVDFINCSKGAYIKGTKSMDFSIYIGKYKK